MNRLVVYIALQVFQMGFAMPGGRSDVEETEVPGLILGSSSGEVEGMDPGAPRRKRQFTIGLPDKFGHEFLSPSVFPTADQPASDFIPPLLFSDAVEVIPPAAQAAVIDQMFSRLTDSMPEDVSHDSEVQNSFVMRLLDAQQRIENMLGHLREREECAPFRSMIDHYSQVLHEFVDLTNRLKLPDDMRKMSYASLFGKCWSKLHSSFSTYAFHLPKVHAHSAHEDQRDL